MPPVSLPIDWPHDTRLRHGGPCLLRNMPIFYDFDWYEEFGHRRVMFPNCKSIASMTCDNTPQDKSPMLLLTNKSTVHSYRYEDSEQYRIHILNVETVVHIHPDAARTLLGTIAATEQDIFKAVQLVRTSAETLRGLVHEELTPELIVDWTLSEYERAIALGQLLTELDPVQMARIAPIAIDVIGAIAHNIEEVESLADIASRPGLLLAAAATRYARQLLALEEFKLLLQESAAESSFQQFLEVNHWMFGTEFIGRWPGRHICIGDQEDFIMESSDGFYDIIELKRPDHEVLSWDDVHNNYYPSPILSEAIGQVQEYLRKIDQELPSLTIEQNIRAYRARAFIVIGYLDESHSDEKEALRGLNSHLSRIQVITYHHLRTMAETILQYSQKELVTMVTQGT